MIVDPTAGTGAPARVESPRRWLRPMLRAGSYAFGFSLLGWALWKNRAAVQEVLGRKPDVRELAVALLLGEAALIGTFARWYLLARAQGVPLTFREALRIGFLGHASELIVPGQLGGDVVKIAAFCRGRDNKAPWIASVLFDRVTGVFGLFLLVSLTGALQWRTAATGVRRLIEVVWVVTAGGALGFATLFLPLAAVLVRQVVRGGRIQDALVRLWDAAAAYRSHPWAVLTALLMAMTSHLVYALSFYAVICALFPVAPPLSTCLVIIPLILFTAIAPLPFGALGVGEEVSGELFRIIGHSIGAPAMLGARCVGLTLNGISVLIYLLDTHALPRPSSPEPDLLSTAAPEETGAEAR